MPSIDKLRRQGLEILSYLWIAVVGTALNWVVAVRCREDFGMGFTSSNATGYAVGIILGFILSRAFSFKNRTSSGAKSESIKFLFVTGVAFTVTMITGWLILFGLSALFEVYPSIHATAVDMSSQTGRSWVNRELIGTIGGTGCGFFVNFFGHKYVTFRKTDTLNRIRRRVTV